MFYPDEKMKVNEFHDVKIPRNAEYFARYGLTTSPVSQYTGDDVAPQPMNKSDMIADMAAYDSMMQSEENSKTE